MLLVDWETELDRSVLALATPVWWLPLPLAETLSAPVVDVLADDAVVNDVEATWSLAGVSFLWRRKISNNPILIPPTLLGHLGYQSRLRKPSSTPLILALSPRRGRLPPSWSPSGG